MSLTRWQLQSFIQKGSSRPLKYSVLSVLFSLVAFLAVSSYYEVNRVVSSFGEVIALEGEKEISSKEDGTLKGFTIEVGAPVKVQQILGQLSIPFTDSPTLLNQLSILKNFYEKQSQESNFRLEWIYLKSENPVVMRIFSDTAQAWKKYELAARESEILTKQKIRILESRKEKALKKIKLLERSHQRQLMAALIDELSEQVEHIEGEKLAISEDIHAKLTTARMEALAQTKTAYLQILEYHENHMIRSPSDGIVSHKKSNNFQQVRKGEPLVSIIPIDAKFGVRLKVPTQQIAKIQSDSTALIEVDAFPYQKFGQFNGQVMSIDRSAQESTFDVVTSIQLPDQQARSPASNMNLLPGMKVKAYIKTQRLTLLKLCYERIFLDESH